MTLWPEGSSAVFCGVSAGHINLYDKAWRKSLPGSAVKGVFSRGSSSCHWIQASEMSGDIPGSMSAY